MPAGPETNGWGESKKDVYHRLAAIEDWKVDKDKYCVDRAQVVGEKFEKFSSRMSYMEGRIAVYMIILSIVVPIILNWIGVGK